MLRNQPRKRDSQIPSTQLLTKSSKLAISLLVLLQMMVVVVEPLHFFTRSGRGASEAIEPIRRVLAPISQFAYLNHGYFFFAPEAGPSHLMKCTLTFEDAENVVLLFPDKQAQWPRLLYHRHFMLAEHLNQLHIPPPTLEVPGGDPRLLRDWQEQRNAFEMVRDSMQEHLKNRYGATSARIDRIEHRLPSGDEVLVRGMRLDDPSLYITLPDGPPADGDESFTLPDWTAPVEAGLPEGIPEEVLP